VAPKSGYRRGYAVAILVGLDEHAAAVWQVYSNVVKPETTLKLEGNRDNPKAVYNFHEALVNALRNTLKQGVRSIVLVSPPRTTYAQEFTNHVKRHHTWLTQGAGKTSFTEMTGSAATRSDVAALVKKPGFAQFIQDATAEETENLLDMLESKLSGSNERDIVLYSLEDVEDLIVYSRKSGLVPDFLLLTDDFLARTRQRGRLYRLMQVAANMKVKTKVVDATSPTGKRLNQLGGIVCLAKKT
jgi:stalled ribosome rescue protein Dom34